MSSSAAPQVKSFPENSVEKKVYNIIESLNRYIPIPNDRNRLAFMLVKFMNGEGDAPVISVKNAKLKLKDISEIEISRIISDELNLIK